MYTFILYGMCSVTVPSRCDEDSSRSLFPPTNTCIKAPSVKRYRQCTLYSFVIYRYCKEVNVKEINMLKCLEIENEIAQLVIKLRGSLPCKPGYLSSIHRTHSRGRLPKVVL